MEAGLLYWILMLFWFLFGLYWNRDNMGVYVFGGGNLVLFILLLILGWKIFGPPLKF